MYNQLDVVSELAKPIDLSSIVRGMLFRKQLEQQEKDRKHLEEDHALNVEIKKHDFNAAKLKQKTDLYSLTRGLAKERGQEALQNAPPGLAQAAIGEASAPPEVGPPAALGIDNLPPPVDLPGIPELGVPSEQYNPLMEALKAQSATQARGARASAALPGSVSPEYKALFGALQRGDIDAASAEPLLKALQPKAREGVTLGPGQVHTFPSGEQLEGPQAPVETKTETTKDPLTGMSSTKTITTTKGPARKGLTAPVSKSDKTDTPVPPAADALVPRAKEGADWTKDGEEFLATLPPQIRSIVKNIAEYKQSPATLGRSQNKMIILDMAAKYNPDYDDKLYTQRRQTMLEFSSTARGAGSNIVALNTGIAHIGKLFELAPGLAGGDVRSLNQLKNYVNTQFLGKPNVTNFQTAASAVNSELASILKKAGATDQEIHVWKSNFTPEASSEQMIGAINTALDVLVGRQDALQDAWHRGMGFNVEDYPIYGKKQQQVLKTLGREVEVPLSVLSIERVQ